MRIFVEGTIMINKTIKKFFLCWSILGFGLSMCSHQARNISTPYVSYVHHSIEDKYRNGHISTQYASDMDGDGFLDIVIRSGKSGPPEIAWYRNPLRKTREDNITWEKIRISNEGYPKGSRSSGTGLTVFDIDRDGRPDVITGANVRGIGKGLFWWKSPTNPFTDVWKRYLIAAPNLETGEQYAPHDIRIADIDQDGMKDLVIGGSSNQGVYWTRIPEDPTRPDSWNLFRIGPPRGYAYAGLAVGDIDSDGRNDIVHANVWYRADGPLKQPHWEPYFYGLINVPPSNIELHDIDKDGRLDIVVASGHNPKRGQVVWYKSRRDPTRPWRPHRISEFLAAPENLVVLDTVDGSSVQVITAELDYQNRKRIRRTYLYIPKNDPKGKWKKSILYEGRNFHMMKKADLDNDGDMDLYAASFQERNGYSHIDWFENRAVSEKR